MSKFLLTLAGFALSASAHAALLFDQNVNPGVIFGSGNANGAFTVSKDGGIELGLRGKLRHDAMGQPQNTFNSDGAGNYLFAAGSAPTQSAQTAVWSFEWSVNVDPSGTSGKSLDDYTYELLLDIDPSAGVSFLVFDPIRGGNPGIGGQVCWDHATGSNATTAATKQVANCGPGNALNRVADYAALLAANNVAQNSWKPHWFIPGFNPNTNGVYTLSLAARDAVSGFFVGATDINIIVGAGAAVPLPGSLALAGLGLVLAGVGARARRLS